MKPLTIALSLAAILIAAAGVSLGQIQAQTNPPPLSAPTGVTAVNGPNPGTVVISWEAVPAATYYRIGWVAYEDYQAVQAEGRNWTEAFTFADFAQREQTSHTLTRLTPGVRYAFIVATKTTHYGEPYWSAWALLTLNADATPCPTATPTPAPPPAPTRTPTPRPTPATAGDYDADQDGLIEISNLAQLNAIRYDLDGDGNGTRNRTAYAAAFPGAVSGMGCPSAGCTGYELVADLDFDTNGSGRADAGDAYWNAGAGWLPLGKNLFENFTATFDGNGHTIASLYINRGGNTGLFGYTDDGSVIGRVGLLAANVSGGDYTGSLVGYIRESSVTASYAAGRVSGGDNTGGLVGYIGEGRITTSYATGSVSGVGDNIGGLVGRSSNGRITASYATGRVSGVGDNIGGLVGYNVDSIVASYASGNVSGGSYIGGLVGHNYYGSITASYASGSVSSAGDHIGGLVGHNYYGKVTASYVSGSVAGAGDHTGGLVGSADGGRTSISYWDTQTTGQTDSDGGTGQTTRQLQSPTGYTGIYANWNLDLDLDGDGNPDDLWDFGTSSQYPALQHASLNPAAQR